VPSGDTVNKMAGRKKRQEAVRRVESRFDFTRTAEAAREAQAAYRCDFQERERRWPPHADASDGDVYQRMWEAALAAYPPGFEAACQALTAGDPSGLLVILDFLEADPYFLRSGYVKAGLLRRIKQLPEIPKAEALRLRAILLAQVDGCAWRREFRDYCRLAPRVATPEFVAELRQRMNPAAHPLRTRLKARRMLALLDPVVNGHIGKPLSIGPPAR